MGPYRAGAAVAAVTLWWLTGCAGAVWLELATTAIKCLSEEIQSNVVVMADYSILFEEHPIRPRVSVKVTSPLGDVLHHADKVSHGQFAFTTAESGIHLACFWTETLEKGMVVNLNPGPEKVYSSGPSSPIPAVSEPSLVMGAMSGHDPEFEAVASSPVSGGGSVPAVPSVEEFIASFKKPLPQPVLPSTPRLRKTRSAHTEDDDDWVPKRSARLAAKSKFRADKPEAQARKVMMKKLGFEIETEIPDEASFDEFQTAFRLPLTPSKREALQVLFPGRKQRALGAVRAA